MTPLRVFAAKTPWRIHSPTDLFVPSIRSEGDRGRLRIETQFELDDAEFIHDHSSHDTFRMQNLYRRQRVHLLWTFSPVSYVKHSADSVRVVRKLICFEFPSFLMRKINVARGNLVPLRSFPPSTFIQGYRGRRWSRCKLCSWLCLGGNFENRFGYPYDVTRRTFLPCEWNLIWKIEMRQYLRKCIYRIISNSGAWERDNSLGESCFQK